MGFLYEKIIMININKNSGYKVLDIKIPFAVIPRMPLPSLE
jgi:hypothetical protein